MLAEFKNQPLEKKRVMEQKVYSLRYKDMVGMDGGTTLGLTFGSLSKTLRALVSDLSSYSAVTLGMGDALAPAMLLAMGANSVGGVELNGFDGHLTAQLHAERMILATGRGYDTEVRRNLYWGTDILTVPRLGNIVSVPPRQGSIAAYSFDDSIPEDARRHWYTLLADCPSVARVATCYNARIDLEDALPGFVEVDRFRITMEGGKCSRTMLLLRRSPRD